MMVQNLIKLIGINKNMTGYDGFELIFINFYIQFFPIGLYSKTLQPVIPVISK